MMQAPWYYGVFHQIDQAVGYLSSSPFLLALLAGIFVVIGLIAGIRKS